MSGGYSGDFTSAIRLIFFITSSPYTPSQTPSLAERENVF